MARFRWMPPPWRLALAFCVLAIGGCAMWDKQGDWGEVRHGLKNALSPDQGGVSSQAADIDRRLQRNDTVRF